MKFPFHKGRLAVDPRGEFVALERAGRTLLGEVVTVRRCDVRGAFLVTVRHFNGEPWPIEPAIGALEWVRQ